MKQEKKAFAEIIESSVTQATGLCWTWSNLPTLCALVKMTQASYTLYGCITNITTGSSDPLRKPFAYQKTEAELAQEQPQIFAFLQTTFTITLLGYCKTNAPMSYLLPPQPPRLHNFIEYASVDEVRAFFANPEFLNLFCMPAEQGINLNELLLALMRYLRETASFDDGFIQSLCQYRSMMHTFDYKELKLFMQRLQKI